MAESSSDNIVTLTQGGDSRFKVPVSLLACENINHSYNQLLVIKQAKLELHAGESIAIVSPSGSGKSTLLRIILGLEKPCGGTTSLHVAPHDLGVVFQNDSVFPWLSVRENVLLLNRMHNKSFNEDSYAELLKRIGLLEFIDHYPWQLSAGMRQKVALARLLLFSPSVYVLDESMANIDDLSRYDLCDELRRRVVSDNQSILFVTHNITDALHLADRILIGSVRPLELSYGFVNPLPRNRNYKSRFTDEFRGAIEQLRKWTENL